MISRALDSVNSYPRARRLEVIEVLRVDLGKAPGTECRAQKGDRGRRGVAGVVPALEGADHRRGPEAIGSAIPCEWLHPTHRTS